MTIPTKTKRSMVSTGQAVPTLEVYEARGVDKTEMVDDSQDKVGTDNVVV